MIGSKTIVTALISGVALAMVGALSTRAHAQSPTQTVRSGGVEQVVRGGVEQVDGEGRLIPQPQVRRTDVPPTNVFVAVDRALEPWGPQLQAISKVLEDMSPYDITGRNDAGIKVISDIYAELALGHLIKGIPGAVRAVKGAGHNTADLAADAVRRGTPMPRRGIVAAADVGADKWKAQLPDGTQLPAHLAATPRPVYPQGELESCAIACTRMVSKTLKGATMPEEWYRRLSADVIGGGYDPLFGTPATHVPELLRRSGIPNSGFRGAASLDDVAQATSQGHPAIVGLNGNHAVVVDAVIPTAQGRFVVYRDPMNLSLVRDPQTRALLESSGFRNHVALPEQAFMQNFATQPGGHFGEAIFTGP